jgi:hypothetical protein
LLTGSLHSLLCGILLAHLLAIVKSKHQDDSTDRGLHPSLQDATMPTSFLGLPKEIRDQIYTLMFLRLSKILARSGLSGFSQYINLLRVSRQIYPECIIVLYGLKTFLIHCMFGGESQYFMRHVGCLQLRKGILAQSLERRQLCRAWFHLRRMSIMDAHTKPGRLEHLLAFAD